ncbi:MAG: DUF3084 domain-containing protein [Clostridia bacterium]|nr:DUF3084 domain-containing protein [Clostridia bacterium]
MALILVLAVTGGVIAYAGDRIGMKVGRKRLSIFGLRPKYTSIIVAVITGVVITACTLFVLTLASENVRTALFRIKEIQDALSTAHSDLETKRAEADALSTRVKEIADEYNNLESQFDVVNSELSEAVAEKAKARKELSGVQAKLTESEGRLEDVKARFAQASAGLGKANADLRQARGDVAGLEAEKSDLERDVAALSSEQARLQAEVSDLDMNVRALIELNARLLETKETALMGQVIFRADQVILGATIDCSQRRDAIENQFNGFLLKVNEIAVRRGASSDDPGGDPFVLKFDEANVVAALQKIAQSDSKVILRAMSPVNSWYEAPLLVSLHVLPDAKIYSAEEVIASKIIDGSIGSSRIQEDMLELVQAVNSACIAEGMASDEEGKIGTVITISEFTSAIMNMVQRNSKQLVEAVAVRDIWRSQMSPSIKLVVKPM